jgi:hypothetical protein
MVEPLQDTSVHFVLIGPRNAVEDYDISLDLDSTQNKEKPYFGRMYTRNA